MSLPLSVTETKEKVMRRGLASLLLGLSLVVASLSWAGFTLSRTILDAGISERLADQLLDDESVRAALTTRLADSLEEQLPDQVPVPRDLVEGAAGTAIDDPRVESVIRDGFVQAHQNALAGIDEPIIVETTGLSEAGRDALIAVSPTLARFIPQSPPVEVELPTTGLSWVGSVKNFVDRYTIIGAFLAAIGALVALLIAKKRSPVFRRVAFWAFGASAFWLIIGYAVPQLLGFVSPTSSAFASALVRIFFTEMMRPAILMAIFGAVMLVVSFIWPAIERRQGARKLQPRNVIADLRTPSDQIPTTPPLKSAASRVQSGAAELPLAETKAGWMTKDSDEPLQSVAELSFTESAALNTTGNFAPTGSTSQMQTLQTENRKLEPTSVIPKPSTEASVDREQSALELEPTEESVASVKPKPEWVAGEGYIDDSRLSPFLGSNNQPEDIDLDDGQH